MPDPYKQRIQEQKQRIRQHKGDDSQLRDRLSEIRKNRNQAGGGGAQNGNGGGKDPFNPTPWNAQYESTVGAASQDYDLAQPALTAQEGAIEKAYGFNDSSDPFSRASQLQAQFSNAFRGTGNNYAAAGQLYAGSLNNARDIDRNNFDQAWDAGQKEMQSKLYEVQQQRLAAQQQKRDALLAAEAQRLESAVQEPVDPAEAPPQGGNQQQGNQGGNQRGNQGGKGKDKDKNDKGKKKGK